MRRNGGGGKHPCAVALGARQKGTPQKGDGTGKGDNHGHPGVALVVGSQAHDKIDACFNHGCGVEHGGNGSRGDHGSQKPALERKEGGFGKGGNAEENRRKQRAVFLAEKIVEALAPCLNLENQNTQHQENTAEAVDEQCPHGIFAPGLAAVLTDEGVTAQSGSLPEEAEEGEVVGNHKTDHQTEEAQKEEVKSLQRACSLGGVFLVTGHVAHGKDQNRRTHTAAHQQHDP